MEKRIKLIILTAVMVICMQSIPSFAHEFDPPRRWGDVRGEYPYQYVYIAITTYFLDWQFNTAYYNTIYDMPRRTQNDLQIEEDAANAKVIITSSEYMLPDFMDHLTVAYADCDDRDTSVNPEIIRSAWIYLNKNAYHKSDFIRFIDWNDQQKQQVISHEIGHVLGLAHPDSYDIQSIMLPGKGNVDYYLQYPEYWLLTGHDIFELSGYYY